jgi:hypothetical protein
MDEEKPPPEYEREAYRRRERLLAALDALAESPKGEHPEWDGPDGVTDWLREERRMSDRPFPDR